MYASRHNKYARYKDLLAIDELIESYHLTQLNWEMYYPNFLKVFYNRLICINIFKYDLILMI